MRIKLEKVYYIPERLEPSVLYLSESFDIAIHLCPCGCGFKVRTPLGLTEWQFTNDRKGPTLYPSIGNWQLPCQSHYWITEGDIIWAAKWTPSQIIAGRRYENERREKYYSSLSKNGGKNKNPWKWIRGFFKND